MKRRDFFLNTLKVSSLLLLKSCGTFSSPSSTKRTFLIGDGKEEFINYDDYTIAKSLNTSLAITDSYGEFYSLQAPCKAHEIALNPALQNFVFATSKWGSEAYVANYATRELIATVKASEGSYFYGHSVFSSDGNFIFATMMNHNSNYGYISVRDSKNLKEIKQIPTQGSMPHQLKWIEVDKVLAVLNSIPAGSNYNEQFSTLNFIDIKKHEVIRSFKTTARRHSHFTYLPKTDTAFLGRSSSTKNSDLFEYHELKQKKIILPFERMQSSVDKSECLSHFIIEENSLAFMTLTGLNKVVVWDYARNRILQVHDFSDSPRGIQLSPDRKIIYVAFTGLEDRANYLNFYYYDTFLQKDIRPFTTFKGGNGSHLTLA